MKQKFITSLSNRFFIRFHMSLILSGMIVSGFLSSKTLLALGLDNIALRYPLSFLISYLVFFGLVKLWLCYVLSTNDNTSDLDDWDFFDIMLSRKKPSWNGSGGKFSGGGASGSWEGEANMLESKAQVTPIFIPSSSSSKSFMPDLGDLDDGAAPLIVIVFVFAVVAAIVGASAYLIIEAPILLGDVAFQMALSVGILKSKDRLAHPYSWMKESFQKTIVAFSICFIILTVGAAVVHSKNPEIKNYHQIIEWVQAPAKK